MLDKRAVLREEALEQVKCDVPLEPSPLRVEVVDQREDDEDVTQHAQAASEAAEYPGRGEAEVCDVVVVPAAVTLLG